MLITFHKKQENKNERNIQPKKSRKTLGTVFWILQISYRKNNSKFPKMKKWVTKNFFGAGYVDVYTHESCYAAL